MSDSVACHQVILWLILDNSRYDFVQLLVVRVSEENRLDVGVVHAHVLHAVFLLVAACQLMLPYLAGHVVVNIGADNKSVLCASVHSLCINVVVLLLVLHKPSVILKFLEILSRLLIDLRVVLACALREVYFWLYYMIK